MFSLPEFFSFHICNGNNDSLLFDKKSKKLAASSVSILILLLVALEEVQLLNFSGETSIVMNLDFYFLFIQSTPFLQLLKIFSPDCKCNVYSR